VRAAVVGSPGEDVEITERERPDPGPGEVRLDVAACGVCGGDMAVLGGGEGVDYPRVPGHEIAGRIDAVGPAVSEWSVGDRVAVGWHGGHCFSCSQCAHGNFTTCADKRVTGISRDGGLAEYATVRQEAMTGVPDGVDLAHAGPLVCAGLTAYNVLRNSETRPGDVVAVQGVGGVGHMGIQFADAMGYETVALSRGPEKREPAFDLGADRFVDTTETDPAEALGGFGGADAILATAPSAQAMEQVIDGLAPEGELLLIGAPQEPLELQVGPLLDNRWSVKGWSAGHPGDARDTLKLTAERDIEPWIETYSLGETETAVRRLLEGEARFRTVLEP